MLSSLVWCLSFLQRPSEESIFLLLSLFAFIYSLFILKRVHGFLLCQVCSFHQDFGINRDKYLAMHISGSKQQQLSKSVWQMWPKTLAQEIHCLQMCIQVKSSLPPCLGHEKSRSCKTMVLSVLLVKHCPDHFALIL